MHGEDNANLTARFRS